MPAPNALEEEATRAAAKKSASARGQELNETVAIVVGQPGRGESSKTDSRLPEFVFDPDAGSDGSNSDSPGGADRFTISSMDPQTLVIVLRMLERIAGVLVGGLLVYFGYRLFLDVRGKRGRDGGSGDFSLAGGTKLKLSKVGPGVFFALFGAGLIVFSLMRPVSLTTTGPAVPSAKEAATATVATVKFMGAATVPETDEERARRRADVQRDISALNQAVERAAATDQIELQRAVSRAKLALMEPLWAEDWGDLADFRDWLEKGGAPPAGVENAAAFYSQR